MRLREQLAMGAPTDLAPRLKHASKNTGRAALKAANDAIDRVSPMRRRRAAARRRTRMMTFGIMMLAVPIGIRLGRMLLSDDEEMQRIRRGY